MTDYYWGTSGVVGVTHLAPFPASLLTVQLWPCLHVGSRGEGCTDGCGGKSTARPKPNLYAWGDAAETTLRVAEGRFRVTEAGLQRQGYGGRVTEAGYRGRVTGAGLQKQGYRSRVCKYGPGTLVL